MFNSALLSSVVSVATWCATSAPPADPGISPGDALMILLMIVQILMGFGA